MSMMKYYHRYKRAGAVVAGSYAAGSATHALVQRARGVLVVPSASSRSFRRSPGGGKYSKFQKKLLRLKENCFIDNDTLSPGPVSGTSSIVLMNGVAQGDTRITRDGQDIYIMSVQYKASILLPVTSLQDSNYKVFLVQKDDVRGATIAITDLFKTDSINAMRAINNSKNLHILKQWNRKLKYSGAPAADDIVSKQRFEFYYKFKVPLRTKYSGTGATITSIDRNGLFLVFMTSSIVTHAITFTGQSRVIFKDI